MIDTAARPELAVVSGIPLTLLALDFPPGRIRTGRRAGFVINRFNSHCNEVGNISSFESAPCSKHRTRDSMPAQVIEDAPAESVASLPHPIAWEDAHAER